MATPVSARWTRIATDIIVFAAAAYFAYVGAFIYYFHKSYSTNSGGQRYCFGPQFVTAQVCNDWQEIGSSTRLLFTLGFLVAFLVVALIARKFVWLFLVMPLVTLQFVNVDRSVWLVSLTVAIAAPLLAFVIGASSRRVNYRRLRFAPLIATVALTSVAAVLSALNAGPPVPSLRTQSALSVWPGLYLSSISCPAAGYCQAAGTPQNGVSGVVLTLRSGLWSAEYLPLGPDYDVPGALPAIACSQPGDCLLVSMDSLFIEHDGTWGPNEDDTYESALSLQENNVASCSPRGDCWTLTYSNSLKTGVIIGEYDGQWLPPHVVKRLRSEAFVFSDAISCWSQSSCTVYNEVSSADGNHHDTMNVQTETNGTWSPAQVIRSQDGSQVSPVWSNPIQPGPLACVSGVCWLGGSTNASQDVKYSQSVALYGAGHAWMIDQIGGSTNSPRESTAETMSCASLRLCVASGGTIINGSAYQYFQAEVNGTWQRPLIEPIKNDGYLDGEPFETLSNEATCATSLTCYVVGTMNATNGPQIGFLARYEGNRWTFDPLALDQGESFTDIRSISCVQSSCWAVGYSLARSWTRGFVFRLKSPH